MSYLPSGTTYPTFNSQIAPGLSGGGQDYVTKFYNSSTDVTGTSGANTISTSRTGHNFSGTATYLIGSATPATFQIFDTFGGAAGANITVSGATINGASTATISTAYGAKTFVNVSGSKWNAF